MFQGIRTDIQAAIKNDPAARSRLEVFLCYPGLHAVIIHRLAHWLWVHRVRLLARYLSEVTRFVTGIEIHPGARIAHGFFIDHGMGTVIGETTEIGEGCVLYQGVTLGGTGKESGKRHPTLGRNVKVGVGASVLGSITIGDNAIVGAGSVVIRSVPANCVVVGIPARVVRENGRRVEEPPSSGAVTVDPCEQCLREIENRFAAMEKRMEELQQRLLQAAGLDADQE